MSKSIKKYCFVEECANSTVSTPNKVFVLVPKNPAKRKLWFEAVGRDLECYSPTTTLYCCEDHFDLPNDMDNWLKYCMTNCKIQWKENVVPHIFHCKRAASSTDLGEDSTKRQRTILTTSTPTFTEHESKASTSSIVSCTITTNEDCQHAEYDSPNTSIREARTFIESQTPLLVTKSIQVKPKYRSKYSQWQSINSQVQNVSTSPLKGILVESVTSPMRKKPTSVTFKKTPSFSTDFSSTTAASSTAVATTDLSDSLSDESSEVDKQQLQMLSVRRTLLVIKNSPCFYVGIPKECYFLVNLLCEQIKSPTINVLLCLKKIRQNTTFFELADDFGMSESQASRIFKNYVPLIAHNLKDFIIWPNKKMIVKNLPIPFRFRYGKVQSIIDCLEIQIEKPSHPVKQSLTWSEYKKCNTIKYLVSCTPDGLINFVSKGYSGRITDINLVEECGYFNCLSEGMEIMANRGFKHLEQLLISKKCKLVRPPSVYYSTKPTKKEVMESKRIASLRIHVEKLIRRLREFKFLEPHATIDNHLIPYTDHVINIAAALINLQGPLIKSE